MKKILTLMAAMSAASGAFAHDFNWNFSSLQANEDLAKVQEELGKLPYGEPNYGGVTATGSVKITVNGLAFTGGSIDNNNIAFTVQANDEVTVTANGSKDGKFYVALDGVITTAEMKDATTLKINVGNATNVQVWAAGDVTITSIAVQSKAFKNVQKDINETLEILNRRVEDINGYAAEVPGFYTKVKAQINAQGKEITDIQQQLLDLAAKNEVSNNGGEATLCGLLSQVRVLLGTKGEGATDAEKGTIYTEAKTAYAKYKAIVTTDEAEMATEVKDANKVIKGSKASTDADWNAYDVSTRFYDRESNASTGGYDYTEKWQAGKTANGTAALASFKSYVENFKDKLVRDAAAALEKYPETAEINNYASKFSAIATRAKNIYDRYNYEEQKVNNVKNYDAIKDLKESVANMKTFSAKNTTLFDQTGLEDLATNTAALFKKIENRGNTWQIANPSSVFGTPFATYSATANAMKVTWGNAAKDALEKEYNEVQKQLDACSEAITTKFQNDQETLKKYELDFAAKQAKITEIKDACKAFANSQNAKEGYELANAYDGYMTTLNNLKGEIQTLWGGAQDAENQAIIKKNNDNLKALETARDKARANYNKAVAQLDSYRKGAFFAREYTYNSTIYADLKDEIDHSIKTLYDYSVAVEKAYEDASKKVADCNKTGNKGEIVAELADLSEFETAITTNVALIETELTATVANANNVTKTFFNASDSNNSYKTFQSATTLIQGYITGQYSGNYDGYSVDEIAAANTDFNTEAAFSDARDEINKAVDGTNDAQGNLIRTTEDIASAKKTLQLLYDARPQMLADDVVKADGGEVVTTINNAVNKANNVVAQLQSYVGLRKQMFTAAVEWSVAQSKAAGASDDIKAQLIDYLATLNKEMKDAEDSLKTKDKLNADVDAYQKKIDDFNARIEQAKSPEAFKKYLAVEKAKAEIDAQLKVAQASIDEATAELDNLTKESAKSYLEGEIKKANEALIAVKTDIENSKDLDADKTQILADINKINLKVAIAAAKKLDTEVPGDYNEDGVVDEADLDIATKKYDNEQMTQSEYSVFIETYRKALSK